MGWVVNAQYRPLHPPGRDRTQETGWVPRPVWTSEENLVTHRDSITLTVQPVASNYIDYASSAHNENVYGTIL